MPNPSRRELLKIAAGSSMTALGLTFSNITFALDSLAKNHTKQALSDEDFLLLTNLINIIFPETDTPAASQANVHVFIDFMFGHWMSKKQSTVFERGLQQVNQIAERDYKNKFLKLDDENKIRILVGFEAGSSEEINKEEHAGNQAFFALLKHLTIIGFFTSETGAKAALVHDPLPGEYLGCVDIDEKYRSSYIDIFHNLSQQGYTGE